MLVLYPANPLQRGEPDQQFVPEAKAVLSAGFKISLFSFEDFQSGELRASPPIGTGTVVLYRGWMLSAADYERMTSAVTRLGGKPLVSTKEYLANHHLPNWYPLIKDLTPETHIYPADCALGAELGNLAWPEYFIKDYVKSLKTSAGSRISRLEQIPTLVDEMRRFRGAVEGGFCVRRIEPFLPQTERRYFVVNGIPHAAAGKVPPIVHECANRLQTRFYSLDVVQRQDGKFRVVEVGDGQVSDLVGWPPEKFANVLTHLEKP
jgi:hypothetical protein